MHITKIQAAIIIENSISRLLSFSFRKKCDSMTINTIPKPEIAETTSGESTLDAMAVGKIEMLYAKQRPVTHISKSDENLIFFMFWKSLKFKPLAPFFCNNIPIECKSIPRSAKIMLSKFIIYNTSIGVTTGKLLFVD